MTARPSILHDDVGRYVHNVSDEVELTQTVSASMHVRVRVELSTVSVVVLLKQGLVRNSHQLAFVIVA